MNRNFHALILALFLAAISLAVFFHKIFATDVPLLPNQAYKNWYVEAKLSINSEGRVLDSKNALPTQIELQLPQTSPGYEITSEDFINDSYTRQVKKVKDSSNRVAVFSNKNAKGSAAIFYRAIIDKTDLAQDNSKSASEPVSMTGEKFVEQQLSNFGEDNAVVEDNLKENFPVAEIESIFKEAKDSNNNTLDFAKQIYQLALNPDDIRIRTIQRTLRIDDSTPELAAFLLKQAKIPVRVGNGILFNSEEVYSTDFIQWLEVKTDRGWLAYDTIDGNFGTQNRYLTWWYGTDSALSAKGSGDVNLEVVVRPNTDKGINQALWEKQKATNPFLEYSLLNLPLATQKVFRVLVLVPIGALIISVLHQMVGLQTFGTFTPILIALAFRETGLIVGIPLFVLVVIIGLLIRAYLDKLQLLIVPRLAAILTATVLTIGILAIILQRFGINLGLSISLFPIVILAMLIERAALSWEEAGAKETIIAGLGTVFVAVIGYLCVINPYVQHLAFTFPELLLLVLGINILVGRYNGYKLTEYFRFKSMQKQLSQS
ncbi:MAG: UUP1 family membrane protein [Rivularia sp. (in: Bacteria)]|nr:UUP1 family membrane protein [Rivularia sp. MS3]